ncbi:MAG: UDP-3-O-(3-hydroxymyristoyl)glucosamine N-acyltransferase [Bacteroidetes bacterium]|nr:UDP-3-O-(3-hydroxymyristoyl)glucosamine N-acyltransferase [Bacteroidota bacterium]
MQVNPISISEVAGIINARYVGYKDHLITGLNEIHRVKPGDIVFVDHPKYYDKALNSAASTIIINKEVECPLGKALLIHPEPFTAFNQLTLYFQPKNYSSTSISSTARIGKNTTIMPGCFIGNNVVIGDTCLIHPNVVIYDNCTVGNNVTIHPNTTIGSDAFYFKKRTTFFEALNTCGRVIIEDNVVIGANCTVDKGVTSVTRIGKGSILDNQVHIGHDVEIGEMCLFAAQVGIAGCCTIGNGVTMWGQVGVSSGITIEDGATILAQSGLGENIKRNTIYFGTPAAPARDKMRELFATKQLPKLIKKLYEK